MDSDAAWTGTLFPQGATTGDGRDHLDRYYTKPELAHRLVSLLPILPGHVVLEPSAGGGAFVRALQTKSYLVAAMDLDPDARGLWNAAPFGQVGDFLAWTPPGDPPDWIVGNPPYRDAERHVRHALGHAQVGVAFLLRLAFLESTRRLPLWQEHPVAHVEVLAERPSFTDDGRTDGCAYAMFVWDRRHEGQTTMGIRSWK